MEPSGESMEVMTRKVQSSKIFSCKDLRIFIDTVRQILPFQGYNESTFFMCEIGEVRFLTKLSFYQKTSPELYGQVLPKDVSYQNEAEIAALSLLGDTILDAGISPCIVRLVFYKICESTEHIAPPAETCNRLLLETRPRLGEKIQDLFCRYHDRVRAGIAHNRFCFLVLEYCDITFEEFTQGYGSRSPIDFAVFRSLLFMLIYTLYRTKKLYPSFRHNDLHTNNVMLAFDPEFKFNPSRPKFLHFKEGGNGKGAVPERNFYVPYFGIIPKIIDFGFVEIPERKIVSNIVLDRQMMYVRGVIDNDLIPFLHYVFVELHWDRRVEKLLRRLEPTESYRHYPRAEYLREVREKVPSYADMVNNHVWAHYATEVPEEQIWERFT